MRTVSRCARFTARWTAILGYVVGLVVLLASQSASWTLFLFPLWVLTVSLTILVEQSHQGEPEPPRAGDDAGSRLIREA